MEKKKEGEDEEEKEESDTQKELNVYTNIYLIKSEKANNSKFVLQYPFFLMLVKWLSKLPFHRCSYICLFFIIKSQISSLIYSAVNCPPKTILFKVWKRQLPSVSLGIILKLEVKSVVFISSSSDSPVYSEDSSVISSVKI